MKKIMVAVTLAIPFFLTGCSDSDKAGSTDGISSSNQINGWWASPCGRIGLGLNSSKVYREYTDNAFAIHGVTYKSSNCSGESLDWKLIMSSGNYTTGSKVTLQSGLVVNEINYTNTAGNTTYSIYQIDETSSGLRLFEGVSSSEFDGGSQARRHNRLTSPAYEKTTKPPYL